MEKLQLVARELDAALQLGQQMKTVLQHSDAVRFLHEHQRLKVDGQTLIGGGVAPQGPPMDTMSIGCYF